MIYAKKEFIRNFFKAHIENEYEKEVIEAKESGNTLQWLEALDKRRNRLQKVNSI